MESTGLDTKIFSTRTERRTKDNPHVNGTYIIGMDMGYSGPKCFHENGNFVFPNYCDKLKGDLFAELNKNEFVYEDGETGERFAVGEMATKTLSEDDVVAEDELFGRKHYAHRNFLITFRTALGLALWNKDTDGHDVFLQTGLPPAYMSSDEKLLRKVVEQRHVFKLTAGKETKTFDITLNENQVDIMSQPMGTFYSVVIDGNGNITKEINNYTSSNMMVFDGGFGTLDKFFVKGKQLESKGTDATLGMKRVLEETRRLIHDDLDIDISIPAMQECLKSGYVTVYDEENFCDTEYPIAEYLKKGNEIVREEAFNSIKDYFRDIDYLIMTGGTGACWCGYFAERLKGMRKLKVVPGNTNSNLPTVYANARGYYMYRLNQIKMSGGR